MLFKASGMRSCRERVQREKKRGLRFDFQHLEVKQERKKLRGLSSKNVLHLERDMQQGRYSYNQYDCHYFRKELKCIKSVISLFLVDIFFDYTVPAFHACSLIFLFAFTVEVTSNWLKSNELPIEPKDLLFSAYLVISKFVPIILTL